MDMNLSEVIGQFNALFFKPPYDTKIISGAKEPLYLPADEQYPYARIYSREDFIASALHEMSHWFIAGKKRRQLVDYGYWYEPDGRDSRLQKLFERSEAKPQALEWILSSAVGVPFCVSFDNLDQATFDAEMFCSSVRDAALQFVFNQEIPARAKTFLGSCLQTSEDQQKFTSYWHSVKQDGRLPNI